MNDLNFQKVKDYFISLKNSNDQFFETEMNSIFHSTQKSTFNLNGKTYYFICNKSLEERILVNNVHYQNGYLSEDVPHGTYITRPVFAYQDQVINDLDQSKIVTIKNTHMGNYIHEIDGQVSELLEKELKEYPNDIDNGYMFKVDIDTDYRIDDDTRIENFESDRVLIQYTRNNTCGIKGYYEGGYIYTNQSPTYIYERLKRMVETYFNVKMKNISIKEDDSIVLMECIKGLGNIKSNKNINEAMNNLRLELLGKI